MNARRLHLRSRLEQFHAHRGIDCEQSLAHRFSEADAQHFQAEIRGRAREFFRLTIAESRDVACLQRGKVALGFRSEKFNEAFDDAPVTVMRGPLRFDLFRLQPRFAPRFDGRARQRFDVGRSEHVG